MRTIPRALLFSTCFVTLALVACGAQTEAPAETAEAPPLADEQLAQELPAGHPTIGEAPPASDMGIVQPPPDAGTGTTGLTWQVPDGWIQEQPSSAMRKAQYRVQGEDGDAECVVFYFGPGQGGDAMANAMRWADQFSQADGSSSRDALITEQINVSGVSVLFSEVTGIYSGGQAMMGGPSESLESYMLLGAVAEGPDANWFFKLTGPEATVAGQKDAFRGMVESLSQGS